MSKLRIKYEGGKPEVIFNGVVFKRGEAVEVTGWEKVKLPANFKKLKEGSKDASNTARVLVGEKGTD